MGNLTKKPQQAQKKKSSRFREPFTSKSCMTRGFQGLRRSEKRSILDVCEHFRNERNAEITRQTAFDYLL